MILKGNARGGANDLALHLMKDENEHIEVHELRGFVSGDLQGALQESYAISRGTKCRQFLYSLSLNPPKDVRVSTDDFEAAIEKVEERLGLTGQPRAVVFHEKEGRRHAHAVWSRINVEEMKAVQLSFDHQKLQTISRELYREHGWQMPRGLANRSERDPLNFTLEEWQQAKRLGKDTQEIKAAYQDAWAISDSKASFTHALAERGYHLARGDRRGFVGVDTVTDEVFAVPRWVGVKTRVVRDRLGDEDALPSISETRAKIAQGILPKLQSFHDQVSAKDAFEKQEYERQKAQTIARHRAERTTTHEATKKRATAEAKARQARFRKGLGGLWDRVRGQHKKIENENKADAERCVIRDRAEKDALSAKQLRERRVMLRIERGRRKAGREVRREITRDIQRFRATGPPGTTRGDFSEATSGRQTHEDHLESRLEKSRRERPRRRRGPSPSR